MPPNRVDHHRTVDGVEQRGAGARLGVFGLVGFRLY